MKNKTLHVLLLSLLVLFAGQAWAQQYTLTVNVKGNGTVEVTNQATGEVVVPPVTAAVGTMFDLKLKASAGESLQQVLCNEKDWTGYVNAGFWDPDVLCVELKGDSQVDVTFSGETTTPDVPDQPVDPEQNELAPNWAYEIPGPGVNRFHFDDAVLGSASNFTYSVWVRADYDSWGSIQLMGHVDKSKFENEMSGVWSFGLFVDTKCKLLLKTSYGVSVSTEETLKNQEWAFMSVVVDNDNKTITAYKNGKQILTASTGTTGVNLVDNGVFSVADGSMPTFIDEAQLWNKALTAEEITASMATDYNTVPEELVAYYVVQEMSEGELPNLGHGGDYKAGVYSGGYEDPIKWEVVDSYPLEGHTNSTEVNPDPQPETKQAAVAFVQPEGGALTVEKQEGDAWTAVSAGDKVAVGTVLKLTATPDATYECTSLTVNGAEQTLVDGSATYTVQDTDVANGVIVAAAFSKKSTGLDSTELAQVRYDAASCMLYAPASAQVEVYNVVGTRVAMSVGNLNLSTLAEGVYLVRVSVGDEVATVKVCR